MRQITRGDADAGVGDFQRGHRTFRAQRESHLATGGRVLEGIVNKDEDKLVVPKLVPPAAALTEREREILDLLTAGLSNKEIGQRLYLRIPEIT